MKITNLLELQAHLPEQEWILTDILREVVKQNLPQYCKEKIAFNVPYFYGSKGICIIWPASVPRGGIKNGVLFGFWQGYLLNDINKYLVRGTNKKVFYKIYHDPVDIDLNAISALLEDAVRLDATFKQSRR